MTVKEFLLQEGIHVDFIDENMSGSYWEKCDSFVRENWDRDMDSLSEKQFRWLSSIRDDLAEKRIEG